MTISEHDQARIEATRKSLTSEEIDRIYYAVGHLHSAEAMPEDAHAGDSAELGLDALSAIIAEREARARAKELRDFVHSNRLPGEWVMFRRDDGSGVTVAELMRERADRILAEAGLE